jgi:methylmalonyl-CoA mutase N-terminal domain/subunit
LADRKDKFLTPSGLTIAQSYNTKGSEIPGQYPFSRGIHAGMYRTRLWTMRQYAGFGTAAETNARYRLLLNRGVSGLSVAFDLPTQMGRDPDHPLSVGEVGKVGVSISSILDMRELFNSIPLSEVSVSMTINSTAAILLALIIAVGEEQGVSSDKLQGTIQNDVLKEYIARGTYIYPPEGALRIATDIFSYCKDSVPTWNTISISGYHIREAGSTAVEELAFTFANGIAYVESALNAGLKIDDFAPRLAFFFNCHNDFLEEVSKFRAARRIWAKIMKERFKAKDPRSMMLRFHTQTAGSSLTAQQPLNNITRTTIQAMAAICGGTQSLHTNSFDEALGLPTEQSATVALRTQQIIAEESGLSSVADPLGGSYLIEDWTTRIEEEVFKHIALIDNMGGMVKAISASYPQSAIERSAYDYQKKIETGDQKIVGVNAYKEEGQQSATPVMKVDLAAEKRQVERIIKLKKERDAQPCQQSLNELKAAAINNAPLMPLILKAVKSYATLGEISDVLRDVFGEYGG